VIEVDSDYAEGRAWLAYLYAEQYHHRRNERHADSPELTDRLMEGLEKAGLELR
jgi:hypothetical protein